MENNNQKDVEMLTRISWMYYFGRMNQQEIADEFSLSRIKVNRLLQQALNMGIVHITIGDKNQSIYSYEQELKQLTGIKYCVVVPSLPDIYDALSRGTAHLCNDIIGLKGSLGVGLSRSIKYLYKYLDREKCKVDAVISMEGTTGPDLALTPFNSGFQIAQALETNYYTIWLPVVVEDGVKSEIIKKDKYISQILKMAENSSYALVGIGAQNDSQIIEMEFTRKEERDRIAKTDAVGEILGHYFTIRGEVVHTGIEDRIISVDFPMKCPVIGIAGMPNKIKAITGALRTGWLNGLVTDENTAMGILKLLKTKTAAEKRKAADNRCTDRGGQ
jgi:DNA-binding transcriptional regulator LsrR (DeoR family)